MFLLSFLMTSKVLGLGLLINKDILVVYFYQQLLQASILLDFDQIRIVTNKISLYSTCFTI